MNVYEFVIKSRFDYLKCESFISTGNSEDQARLKLEHFYGKEFKNARFSEIVVTPVEEYVLHIF